MTDDKKQPTLFQNDEAWKEHWKDMPEFVQEDLSPYKTIYVYFETREAMEKFSKLVDQTITLDTRSIWYPKAEIGHYADRRYVDTLPDPDEPREEE